LISSGEYYSRFEVQDELSEFCKGRWVAVHQADASGNLIFQRYFKGRPLKIENLKEFSKVLNLKGLTIRSVYATANVYNALDEVEDVYDFSNIKYCTPTWDIDGTISNWRETLLFAKEIIRYLNSRGIKESVYIKWSGNGCHVHLHERAVSTSLLEHHNPLDLAFSIVEYVRLKLFRKFKELSPKGETVVENKMDLTRVFTCPLSLHRKLDVACVCMKPDQMDEFTPEWLRPESFVHNKSWRDFCEGEADEVAKASYSAIGGYPLYTRKRRYRRTKPLDELITTWLNKK